MESTRQQKINRLIQKELSGIFQNDTRQMGGIFVTISEVRATSDLGIARIYLSIFPNNKGKELLENIQANTKKVRYDLGLKLGKQLRVIPQLEFYLDDSLEYLEKIDKLLDKDKEENNEGESTKD